MGKLHRKMVALGDMTQYTYDQIVEKVGEPVEKHPCTFSDIGEGSRATWSDRIFTITFNFDPQGHYCGIYHHRNWSPYIWLTVVTVALIAAALIWGAWMRKNTGDSAAADFADSAAMTAVLTGAQDDWRTDKTAGISLLDLDFDGTPELLAVDTEFSEDKTLGSDFFGTANVRIFRITPEGVAYAGKFSPYGYCFTLELRLEKEDTGAMYWCADSDSGVLAITGGDEGFAALTTLLIPPTETLDVSRGMRNESWVSASGGAELEKINADIAAVCSAWFEDMEAAA